MDRPWQDEQQRWANMSSREIMLEAGRIERERTAILYKPLPPNPEELRRTEELTRHVNVRVLKPFMVMGQAGERWAKVGEVVTLFNADAQSLAAQGKCEMPAVL